MKNIADVNSDDILSQLNNLDYDVDDDLKLLDDEDIRPINNSVKEDDLSDFYKDYTKPEPKKEIKQDVDLYTEKTKVIEPITPAFEEKTIRIDPPKPTPAPVVEKKEEQHTPSIDTYLNRKKAEAAQTVSTSKTVVVQPQPQSVMPSYAPKKEQPQVYNKPSTPVVNNNINKSNDVSNVTDINQLFNKVSNNVKGASEIVNRNAEIKKKIEAKFEELRKMQEEHEYNKKRDYDEINAYKDEVYTKLQQKKADMERDLNSLRKSQEKFEKEKKTFEEYKNTSLSNLNKLEKELKDSYESRNKNIEQVEIGLVRRKEQLDIERANIAKEREQVQKEKDELAKNLVQFNKLVSEFTQGIDNFG